MQVNKMLKILVCFDSHKHTTHAQVDRGKLQTVFLAAIISEDLFLYRSVFVFTDLFLLQKLSSNYLINTFILHFTTS